VAIAEFYQIIALFMITLFTMLHVGLAFYSHVVGP